MPHQDLRCLQIQLFLSPVLKVVLMQIDVLAKSLANQLHSK